MTPDLITAELVAAPAAGTTRVGTTRVEERRSRTFTWTDPMATARDAMGRSGLEFLQAMAAGEIAPPPIAELMGFEGFEVEDGAATFFITPAEYHYNPIGVVHGGLAATMFDTALGCAIHSTLPAGTGYTTLELKVNYLRPLTVDTGRVRVEARVIHVGGRVATAEARLLDEHDRLYGHATTTCMIFRGERT